MHFSIQFRLFRSFRWFLFSRCEHTSVTLLVRVLAHALEVVMLTQAKFVSEKQTQPLVLYRSLELVSLQTRKPL